MGHRKLTVFATVILLFLPVYAVHKQSKVYEYTKANFKQKIEEMDGNFVMFYAPWCRHCIEFYPIWDELGSMVNTEESKFAIAQVDCTLHRTICSEHDITGYPSLLYFHKNNFEAVEYKGTRDLPTLTLFLSEIYNARARGDEESNSTEVKIYGGMAYLTDHNIDKFLSEGQHFVMFYVPWCKVCQNIAPVWSEMGMMFANNDYVRVGKINCMYNEMSCKAFDVKEYPFFLWIVNGRIVGIPEGLKLTERPTVVLRDMQLFVESMMLPENHDPDKFMKKKKSLPVARVTEETFETFLQKDVVFINYFAPWCAHCMQMNPLWIKLGEKFQDDERVLIGDVDCVRSKPVCEMEKIMSLPTLILYKNKKIVTVEDGGRPLDTLISLVKQALEVKEDPVTITEVPVTTTEHPVTIKEDFVTTTEDSVTTKEEYVEPVTTKGDPIMIEEEPITTKEKPVMSKEEPVITQEEPVTTTEAPAKDEL